MNKVLILCAGIAAAASVALFIFKIPVNSVLIYGAILLCPLMHIFVMNHEGVHAEKKSEDSKKCH